MVLDEKEHRRKQQADEVFCEIGRFAVRFEHVCFAMRTGITFLLHKGGLRNQQLAHVALAELTAAPLRSILQAMIPLSATLDEQDQKITSKIFKRVNDLIERRNEVIHGTWFVGWPNAGDEFAQADGHKLVRGKVGAEARGFRYGAREFIALTDECTMVEKMVDRLWATIIANDKISNNFVIKGNDVHLSAK